MSIPAMNPTPAVWMRRPLGGDQLPSGRREIKTPEPPAPETHRPVRIVVKIAKATAFLMTLGGILTSTFGFPFGPSLGAVELVVGASE
jgi:hypothetical protein